MERGCAVRLGRVDVDAAFDQRADRRVVGVLRRLDQRRALRR
jgi:hypothetical protein